VPAVKIHFDGQISSYDLRLLRIFKAVVDSGGFTAAEVELNISRSAISAAISDLESRMGLTLCRRGRAGFSLTEAGEQVVGRMRELFGALDRFRSDINAIHTSLKGELRIGITDNLISVRRMRIVHSLTSLKRHAPDVIINIRTMPPAEIEKAVLNAELDIGLLPHWRTAQGLVYEPLYEEESGLYCGATHPLYGMDDRNLSIGDVQRCEVAMPAYALPERMQELFRSQKITATVSDREAVAFLLMTGCYVGLLPSDYAQRWVDRALIRRLLPNEFSFVSQYVVVSRAGNAKNPVVSSYLEGLRASH
jgi:LysR family transcriptional regulator, transcriptional activator for bauABCD operon